VVQQWQKPIGTLSKAGRAFDVSGGCPLVLVASCNAGSCTGVCVCMFCALSDAARLISCLAAGPGGSAGWRPRRRF
jgi:hypothetical protein